MYRCIKQTWLHWVALKIIIRELDFFSSLCFLFSVPLFLPPTPQSFLPSFPFFSLFPFSFEASLFCFLLSCCASFFSSFSPSLAFASFFFYSMFSFQVLLFVCRLFTYASSKLQPPNSQRTSRIIQTVSYRGSQGLRGLSSVLPRPFAIVTGGLTFPLLFVWSEFSTITQDPGLLNMFASVYSINHLENYPCWNSEEIMKNETIWGKITHFTEGKILLMAWCNLFIAL